MTTNAPGQLMFYYPFRLVLNQQLLVSLWSHYLIQPQLYHSWISDLQMQNYRLALPTMMINAGLAREGGEGGGGRKLYWFCVPMAVESYGACCEAQTMFTLLAIRLAVQDSHVQISQALCNLHGRKNITLVRAEIHALQGYQRFCPV